MKDDNNQNEAYIYTVKDGVFLDDYDKIYKSCADSWGDYQHPNKYSKIAGLLHIKKFKINSLLECGCGLGYYSRWINEQTNILPISIDISKTYIEKARKLFPDLKFEIADISTDLYRYKNIDCILFSEVIWFILEDLNKILDDIAYFYKGKYLIINEIFYKGTQKYGKKLFTSPDEFINFIPFKLIGHCEATNINDNIIESSFIFKV